MCWAESHRGCGAAAGPIVAGPPKTNSCHQLYANRPGNLDELCGFSQVSFARIAEEMGCLGIRVEKPHELADVLQEALAADRSAVVDVVTDVNCPAPEPWAP